MRPYKCHQPLIIKFIRAECIVYVDTAAKYVQSVVIMIVKSLIIFIVLESNRRG